MCIRDSRYPGLKYVNVGHVIGTPENVIVEQLGRFGREIIPKIKSGGLGVAAGS